MKQSCSRGITSFVYAVIFPERAGRQENAYLNICTPMSVTISGCVSKIGRQKLSWGHLLFGKACHLSRENMYTYVAWILGGIWHLPVCKGNNHVDLLRLYVTLAFSELTIDSGKTVSKWRQ